MSRIYRAHRTDTNHAEIVQAARRCGFTVFSAHAIGGDFPDLVDAAREVQPA